MPLTEADRAERYRERYREKVCERDNLRKKNQRKLLKALNPKANMERLKNQRIAKAIYRQKKIKEAKKSYNSLRTITFPITLELFSFFSPFYKG